MEKLAIVLIVFVLLGSMSTPCDGLAAGLWVDGKRSVGKRNYKDLNDRYNEVSRSNYKGQLTQRAKTEVTTQSKPNSR